MVGEVARVEKSGRGRGDVRVRTMLPWLDHFVRLIAGMLNCRKRLFASSGLVSRLWFSRIDEKAAWHEV